MTALSTARRGLVDPATPSYRWWLLFVTSIGALLASLNSGTLVIALPEILRDLHTDLFSLLWIVVGYTLVVTVLVLNAGRLADRYGRARTYTLGIAVFTLASVFCAIAPTAFLLILGRVAQGVGGAFVFANSAALVTDAFPRRELGRALGINAMVVGAGLILGPILGGFLTSFGWTFVFWFNVPIGIIGAAAAVLILVEQAQPQRNVSLDLAGSLALPRRAARADDVARVRRHLRLDHVVGHRRVRAVPRRDAVLRVGRVPRVAPRSWTSPSSATASSRWATSPAC